MLLLFALLTGACRRAEPSESVYRVERSPGPAAALFAGDERAWRASQRIAWGPDRYATAFRAVWDDRGLFVRFDVTDPDPWHTQTRHDDKLWNEEVVEIFLQPHGQSEYGEIEISPANVTCDVWVDANARRFDSSWDLAGLESRVITQQDVGGAAAGWTAVVYFPWSDFARVRADLRPRAGDRWRFNVFRIERPGGKDRPEEGALYLAWAPTGKRTFHVPDAFRDFVFGDH